MTGQAGSAGASSGAQRSAFNVTTDDALPNQLYFWTRDGWAGEVPLEQQALQGELDRTCAVLRARFLDKTPERFKAEFDRLLKLAHAAFAGEYAQLEAGTRALEQYRMELVRQEGPAIKNEYLKELAVAALIATLLILTVAIAIRLGIYYGQSMGLVKVDTSAGVTAMVAMGSARWNPAYSPLHFGVLLSATMWGIWLSFAVRSATLRFEQLQHPEEDMMRPWSRLLAFGMLAFILALFFQLGVLVISIGGVSTNQISENLAVALFVGLGLGFTDKALPAEVRRRIEEFFQSAKEGTRAP